MMSFEQLLPRKVKKITYWKWGTCLHDVNDVSNKNSELGQDDVTHHDQQLGQDDVTFRGRFFSLYLHDHDTYLFILTLQTKTSLDDSNMHFS